MNSLFGLELPTSVNFVIAFVVVLALIGIVAWAVRRFGVTRIEAAARARQPRLAVIDSASVDSRRKLVIVRRDNVEHLLMIGGPTDVVVETNIVRAAAGAAPGREAPPVRAGGGAESTLPRVMPLPDPTPWPLQPEPAAPAPVIRQERARPAPEDMAAHWPAQPEPHAAPQPAPAVRPQRPAETLAGLAAELARPEPAPARPAPEPARAAAAKPEPQPAPGSDQNLAAMANRLEAALRRPMPQAPAAKPAADGAARAVAAEPKRAEAAKPAARTDAKVAAAPAKAAPAPAKAATAAAAPARSHYQNLEQEMASLLGRPGKT